MSFLKTAGVAGTIMVILALIITLLKQIIAKWPVMISR
jgi:hypothetical protein